MWNLGKIPKCGCGSKAEQGLEGSGRGNSGKFLAKSVLHRRYPHKPNISHLERNLRGRCPGMMRGSRNLETFLQSLVWLRSCLLSPTVSLSSFLSKLSKPTQLGAVILSMGITPDTKYSLDGWTISRMLH